MVPLAVSVPPFKLRFPANVEVVPESIRVSAPPVSMVRLLLAVEFRPLILRALVNVALTPATRFNCTTSVVVGSASPVQLNRFSQVVSVPAPPSQQMPVQVPPVCVRR